METGLTLLIVIVNYKTPDLTINCLKSLSNQIVKIKNSHVVVVDNNSQDGSPEKINQIIKENNWQWVTVLAESKNWGFSGGNNRGLETFSNHEYALLLNSDTIVYDRTLEYCLQVMEEQKDIGVMSCKLLNEDGSLQNVTRKFPNPMRSLISALGLPWYLPFLFNWANIDDDTWDKENTKKDVDWLGGAFLLIRGSLLRKIGGLDEDFFFYGEDIEFNYRVYKAGWRRYYDPTVSIIHLGGGSSDEEKMAQLKRKTYYWQGRYLVQSKCYGKIFALILYYMDLLILELKILVYNQRDTYKYKLAQEMRSVLKNLNLNFN
ncbi:glycosyltransferase family 2 protein [Cyanobacterium aponinum FACHB-4101]|uniref:glycosyltransferase family 2 protein n=1 Tax=Cyanobacterium aponinum TaxID=379064 RepID=UPI001680DA9F|nr:glycosyltransferase family 2 protein [Cyanobacterium aponinum]MBD2394110.1 glycosyltransferase family 2 protein [Cyanobacterium aponinum FACHB-4101]